MHHFYLQHPPSHKQFHPWDVEHLLSLLESWAPISSLTTFKLAWKTATLLALVIAKHCPDLTLLCVDNQHLFLHLFFVPLSGGKTDHPGHLPPQIRIESHSNVNLCPIFYLKAYLRCTESFRKKSDGSHLTSLFWVTIGSIGLSVLIPFLLGYGKFSVLLRHICLQAVSGGVAPSAALVAGVSLVTILQVGDWTRVSTPASHYFSTYITPMDQHQDSVQHAVLGLSE